MKIFPAFPPLLLKLTEETLVGKKGALWFMLVFNRGHFTGWLHKDVSSYPREGKTMVFSH